MILLDMISMICKIQLNWKVKVLDKLLCLCIKLDAFPIFSNFCSNFCKLHFIIFHDSVLLSVNPISSIVLFVNSSIYPYSCTLQFVLWWTLLWNIWRICSKEPVRNPFLKKGFVRTKEIILFVRNRILQILFTIYDRCNSKEHIFSGKWSLSEINYFCSANRTEINAIIIYWNLKIKPLPTCTSSGFLMIHFIFKCFRIRYKGKEWEYNWADVQSFNGCSFLHASFYILR